MSKKIRVTISLLLILVSTIIAIDILIYQQKNDRSVVTLDSREDRKIVFYRDDCTDCQKIYPRLFWHNLGNDDLIFVNLNQQKNRQYIRTYQVKSVPTIVHKESRYEGTNHDKVFFS